MHTDETNILNLCVEIITPNTQGRHRASLINPIFSLRSQPCVEKQQEPNNESAKPD